MIFDHRRVVARMAHARIRASFVPTKRSRRLYVFFCNVEFLSSLPPFLGRFAYVAIIIIIVVVVVVVAAV